MSFRVTVGSATDVGRVREGNEDSLLVRPPLYVVADGMGGHLGGEVASALAIETLAAHVERKGADSLVPGVTEANLAVYEKQKLDPSLAGMGTTLTAALIDDEGMHLAHVGDSRAYLLRGDAFDMVTDDHTMVGELVRAKRLTPDEARVHPQRSMLTRALGIDSGVEVDQDVVPLEDGDRIVLCSDGLNAILTEAQIEELARAGAPTETAHAMVDAANEAGGVDNTTVIVLDISTETGTAVSSFGTMLPPITATPDAEPDSEASGDDPGAASKVVIAKPGAGPSDMSSSKASATVVVPEAARPTTTPPSEMDVPLWRSRIVIAAAVFLLVVAVVVPVYAYSNTYVGVSDGHVAIFHGLPGSFLGIIPLRSVQEVSELDAQSVSDNGGPPFGELEAGIPVQDDEAALRMVALFRSSFVVPDPAEPVVVPPAPFTPPPSFLSPSPSATPSGTPSPSSPAPGAPVLLNPSTSPTPAGTVP